MRTKKATAPQNLDVLLKTELRTFTVADVVEKLDVSYKHARAVIDFGVAMDNLRVVKHPQDAGQLYAIYENPSWRKRWVSGVWR